MVPSIAYRSLVANLKKTNRPLIEFLSIVITLYERLSQHLDTKSPSTLKYG